MKLGDRVEYIDGRENTRVMWVVGVRTNDYVQLAPRPGSDPTTGWIPPQKLTLRNLKVDGCQELLEKSGEPERVEAWQGYEKQRDSWKSSWEDWRWKQRSWGHDGAISFHDDSDSWFDHQPWKRSWGHDGAIRCHDDSWLGHQPWKQRSWGHDGAVSFHDDSDAWFDHQPWKRSWGHHDGASDGPMKKAKIADEGTSNKFRRLVIKKPDFTCLRELLMEFGEVQSLGFQGEICRVTYKCAEAAQKALDGYHAAGGEGEIKYA